MKQIVRESARGYSRALFFLVFFFFIAFYPLLAGGRIFFQRDLYRYFLPLWNFGVETLQSGQIPFWNPFILGGATFLANSQSCVFYPATIIFHVIGVAEGMNIYIVIHLVCAAFFMYLWMKSYALSDAAGLLGSIGYALSGPMTSMINNPTVLSAWTYFPLVLFLYRKVVIAFSFRRIFCTALALSLMFLAGDPSGCYVTFCVIAVFSIFKSLEEKVTHHRWIFRHLLSALGVCLLFVLMTSFQLLPFFEMAFRSNHTGIGFEQATTWSVPLYHLLGVFWPYLPHPGIVNHTAIKTGQYFIDNYYAGIAILVFAAFSLTRLKDRRVQLGVVLLLLSIGLVLGKNSLFYTLFYHCVPFASAIRYPVRFFFIVIFALSFLGGIGFDRILYHKEKIRAVRWKVLFLGTALAAALIFLVLNISVIAERFQDPETPWAVWHIKQVGGTETILPQITGMNLARTLGNLKRSLFFVTLILLGIFFFLDGKITRKAALPMFLLLLVYDLYFGTMGTQPVIPLELYKKAPGVVDFIGRQEGLFRVQSSPSVINKSYYKYSHESWTQYFRRTKSQFAANVNVFFGLQSLYGYEAMSDSDADKYIDMVTSNQEPAKTRLLDIANVKYIITKLPEGAEVSAAWKPVYSDFFVDVFENTRVLPRAFLVEDTRSCANREELTDLLSESFDAERVLYLLEEENRWALEFAMNEGSPRTGGEVSIVSYGNNEVVLDVRSSRPQWLYLADAYESNWKARVNGAPVRIRRANLMFRALPVPAGESRVRFYYVPLMFYIGAAISLITLAASAVFLCRRTKKGLSNRIGRY